jgi:uncharacterized membrane-anchored protein YhcB (DUF1043 family)
MEFPQANWVIYGIGLVVIIAVVVYIAHLARRALGNYIFRRKNCLESVCNKI